MTNVTLRDTVERRFRASMEVPERFFALHEAGIAAACQAMAQRFQRGGRLLVFGEGAEASDAQHVAVEFVHPVIVGKRALPAIALSNDGPSLTGIARGRRNRQPPLAAAVEILRGPSDIAMGITRDRRAGAVRQALSRAGELGMLTIDVSGTCDGDEAPAPRVAEFEFVVDSADPLVVQEVQETLYHVLWELVHVFLDHAGPLEAHHAAG